MTVYIYLYRKMYSNKHALKRNAAEQHLAKECNATTE